MIYLLIPEGLPVWAIFPWKMLIFAAFCVIMVFVAGLIGWAVFHSARKEGGRQPEWEPLLPPSRSEGAAQMTDRR